MLKLLGKAFFIVAILYVISAISSRLSGPFKLVMIIAFVILGIKSVFFENTDGD